MMHTSADLLNLIYGRLSGLRADERHRECLSCECYFALLFLMKEELSKMQDPECECMLEEIPPAFDRRKEAEIHGCLGCELCPPAEWTTELLREAKGAEQN